MQAGNFNAAHATVGEAVGLVRDLPRAGSLIARMNAQAQSVLRGATGTLRQPRIYNRQRCKSRFLGPQSLRHATSDIRAIQPSADAELARRDFAHGILQFETLGQLRDVAKPSPCQADPR